MSGLLLAIPGALAIGLSLGLLGSGGSILTVPVLVYLLGHGEKEAIAGSLGVVGLVALAGAVAYLRCGLIHWRSVFVFGIPGMAGTYAGAAASAWVTGGVQLAVFGLVMLLAAVFMLRPQPAPVAPASVTFGGTGGALAFAGGPACDRPVAKIATDGLLVGVLTGFVGVGGGFLIVPALVILGGLAMHEAVATSLVIIALKSGAGFFKYLDVLRAENLELDLPVLGLIAAVGIAGSFAGKMVADRVPQESLKKLFAGALVVMGVAIVASRSEEFLTLLG